MRWEAWLTVAVVVAVFLALASGRARPVSGLFGGLTVIITVGALTGSEHLVAPAEAVAGFGNSGLITVGLLFVVAAGLVHTGAVGLVTDPLLGRPRRLFTAQLRLLGPVAGLSAFLNNTPIVAVFLPVVNDLARRCRLPASRLYLPLSYAAILGGTCTLIGTSTNLIVDGLARAQPGFDGLGLFDIAWVGVPATVVGIGYILLASPRLLPAGGSALGETPDPRRYTVEVSVARDGPLVGRSIEAAGLRHLPGLFLAEIEREGELLPAVAPSERLHGGDRLVFVGVLESVVDLHRMRGIEPAADRVDRLTAPREQRCLVEAVVSDACPLVGHSIRDGRFRAEYQAAVIAVARGGRRLPGKIGDIVLQAGDTLLLETHPSFLQRQRNARDFFLVSGVEDSTPRRHDRAWIALATLAGMVTLAASGVLTLLNAALLAAGTLVLTGCVTGPEARRHVDWNVLLVIGAALGLGEAIAQSGAAAVAAGELVDLAGGEPLLVLAAIYLVTLLCTELITNNAAAVLVFPIAVSAAETLGAGLTPFVVVVMMAASAAFATPIGYQTNLMVYGPGGYRFADYLRFGLPLNALVMGVTLGMVPWVWEF
ncbi:SLC13 family permease [Sediminicurvatus halobius]|uniref:SLC13 family permease n=1 Tax=Sediminicurvatus halobius TaxID=2182432 RepID=A0A2U2N5D3_9GAMM|nr:SLC13 family permease [Spiribacter halobius]PWG64302.1 SLC13 family permease [Spiribacter halobius]UEX79356.1 SLC13 family permease [Spiribacter halobius]